jgi:hypothetical protein
VAGDLDDGAEHRAVVGVLPVHGHLIHMYARQIEDEIVREQAECGDLVRWIFSGIRPGSSTGAASARPAAA